MRSWVSYKALCKIILYHLSGILGLSVGVIIILLPISITISTLIFKFLKSIGGCGSLAAL
jgi:hypothetical protein